MIQVANAIFLQLLPPDNDPDLFVLKVEANDLPGETDGVVAMNAKGTLPTIQELIDENGFLVGFVVNQQIADKLEAKLQTFYGDELRCRLVQ